MIRFSLAIFRDAIQDHRERIEEARVEFRNEEESSLISSPFQVSHVPIIVFQTVVEDVGNQQS
jgi:hypothetical protein